MCCALFWGSLLCSALYTQPLTAMASPYPTVSYREASVAVDSTDAPAAAGGVRTVELCYGEYYLGTRYFTDTLLSGTDAVRIRIALAGDDSYVDGPEALCADGTAELRVSRPFAAYRWEDGSSGRERSVDRPGTYRVTVSTAGGCTKVLYRHLRSATATVTAADPVRPLCPGTATGSLTVVAAGSGPLLYSLTEAEGYQQLPYFTGVAAGSYTLRVQSPEGCIARRAVEVPAATPLRMFAAGHRSGVAAPGQELPLPVAANFTATDIAWSPAAGLSCDDCPAPVVRTDRSRTYAVTARSPAGCLIRDTFSLTVDATAAVYAPGAFQPATDGVWRLYAGPEVAAIGEVAITDRYGQVWMRQARTVKPADRRLHWDGRLNDATAEAGDYHYTALLHLQDGRQTRIDGSFYLLR